MPFDARTISSGYFTQEELDEKHIDILREFMERIQGQSLTGMLLTSIVRGPEMTSVECMGGATADDSLRAALCILEGVMVSHPDGEPRVKDSDKREVIAGVIAVLAQLSGSGEPEVVILAEDNEGNMHDITRGHDKRGPSLEDDDDDNATRH